MKRTHSTEAFELALVALALDPQSAITKPHWAVIMAGKLLTASQDYIDHPDPQDRMFAKAEARAEIKIPKAERIRIEEVYEQCPGVYKSAWGLAATLRKEGLTVIGMQGEDLGYEFTSKRAVEDLPALQEERRKKSGRERKARAKKAVQAKK